MKIEKNFYGEFMEEYREIIDNQNDTRQIPEHNSEYIRVFMDGIYEARRARIIEKRTEGLCLPISSFLKLVEKGSVLAERTGMDFLAQAQGGDGIIALTGGAFLISKDETPELLKDFVEMLSASERIDLVQVNKYGKVLSKLVISYELEEDILDC